MIRRAIFFSNVSRRPVFRRGISTFSLRNTLPVGGSLLVAGRSRVAFRMASSSSNSSSNLSDSIGSSGSNSEHSVHDQLFSQPTSSSSPSLTPGSSGSSESQLSDAALERIGLSSAPVSDGAAAADAAVAVASDSSLWFNVEMAVRLIEWSSNLVGSSHSIWVAIVGVTVVVRVVTLPVVVASMKNTARMTLAQPEIEAAQRDGKRLIAAAPPGKAREIKLQTAQRVQDTMKRHQVSFSKMFLPMLVQGPLFISFFFALRHMCVAHAADFRDGGALWFVDLTASDPYYRLPLLTGLTMALSLRLGADGMPEARRGPMKVFAVAMVPLMVGITGSFPQALHVYWLTSNTFSVTWAAISRIPAIRSSLGLPPLAAQEEAKQRQEAAHVGKGKVQFFEGGRQAAADLTRPEVQAVDRQPQAARHQAGADDGVEDAEFVSAASHQTAESEQEASGRSKKRKRHSSKRKKKVPKGK